MSPNAGDGQFPSGSFDSLGAVEMANSLSSAVNMKLPQTLVFDYPSVSAMANFVHGLLAPAMMKDVSSIMLLPGAQSASSESLIQV